MMNKLKQRSDAPEERAGPGDYFLVIAQYSTWYVSPQTAARLGRLLDRPWRPRWLKFQDLSGSRAWVRTDCVECVMESTECQRTGEREFQYLLRKETRSDRRWDDEEM